MKTNQQDIQRLQDELELLRAENEQLKKQLFGVPHATVIVPPEFESLFASVEQKVRDCFSSFSINPSQAEIMIGGERYVLFNSASLSYEFLDIIRELYSNHSQEEATRIGNNFRFDIAHVLGKKDAHSFHQRLKLVDPVEKLSAGPVHFAFTGWANVEILPESNPTPDEHFFLKYYHHNSFEAQAWKKAGRVSDIPVCTMSCGYSSGWCEESFGLPLTAVELECEAAGAERCLFVMAPPARIESYLKGHTHRQSTAESGFAVPVFFEKKFTEDKLRHSLAQKETLLSEVHHRVKNNLQLITSLLNLQAQQVDQQELTQEFHKALMRIRTLALVQEMIYSDAEVAAVPVSHFFRHVVLSLVHHYRDTEKTVQISFNATVEEGIMHSDTAIPLALLLNELLNSGSGNIFQSGGKVECTLHSDTSEYIFKIQFIPDTPFPHVVELPFLPLLCEQAEATCTMDFNDDFLNYKVRLKKTSRNQV